MKSIERATCVGETEKEQMQIIIIIFLKKKRNDVGGLNEFFN
jgi:hypothetical protein